MILILAMYIEETVLMAANWYFGWLAFVKYSSSNDQATAVYFFSEETPLTVVNMTGVTNLLTTLKLGIADSITSNFVYSLIQVNYSGLALLDHLES
jgi:hypothetical protein